MYRRSGPEIQYDKQQKEAYINTIKLVLTVNPFCMKLCDYPYNMCRDVPVETYHIIVWYYDDKHSAEQVEWIRRLLRQRWYVIQENPEQEKSCPEIQHFHAIKTIKILSS